MDPSVSWGALCNALGQSKIKICRQAVALDLPNVKGRDISHLERQRITVTQLSQIESRREDLVKLFRRHPGATLKNSSGFDRKLLAWFYQHDIQFLRRIRENESLRPGIRRLDLRQWQLATRNASKLSNSKGIWLTLRY